MLWILLVGCVPPGPLALAPLRSDDPSVIADVVVDGSVAEGWSLEASLVLRNPSDSQRRRIDLSETALRVDGRPWEPCRHAADSDTLRQIVLLAPGEEKARTLKCVDVPPPRETLSLRVSATHASSGAGVAVLEYSRVDP